LEKESMMSDSNTEVGVMNKRRLAKLKRKKGIQLAKTKKLKNKKLNSI
jgi:hypothetical protein